MWDKTKKYYLDQDVTRSLFLFSTQGCSISIQFNSIVVLAIQ